MSYNEYEPYTPAAPTQNNNRRIWLILGGCLVAFLCLGCLTVGVGYYLFVEYGDELLSEFGTATPERRDSDLDEDEDEEPTGVPSGGREGLITPTTAVAEQPTDTPDELATATPEPAATIAAIVPSETINATIPEEIDQQPLPDRAESDLTLLYRSNYPSHDYFDTAVRLGNNNLGPRLLIKEPYSVGDTREFYNDTSRINATLVAVTDHVYFWVEDGLDLDQEELIEAADRFENEFYPQLVHLFGEVWTPGSYGDPRVSVLHTQNGASDELGRFNMEDEYPSSLYRYSNEQELIYMNMGELTLGSNLYYGTLVHEVQHLIQWYIDPSETVWLNEGLAQLAELYVGFDDTAPSTDSFEQPAIRLHKLGL